MKKLWRPAWQFTKSLAPYLAIGAICLGVSLRLAFLNFPHSTDAAAWFQGLGTVAAVFMTMSLAFRAENNAKRAAIEERRRFVSQVASLAAAAHMITIGITQAIDNRDSKSLIVALAAADDIRDQFTRWSTLPIQNWPTPFLAVAFDALGREFEKVASIGRFLAPSTKNGRSSPPDILLKLKQAASDFQVRLQLLSDHAELATRA
jgi:hypothetical protein